MEKSTKIITVGTTIIFAGFLQFLLLLVYNNQPLFLNLGLLLSFWGLLFNSWGLFIARKREKKPL
jgi:hypothetical protein